jgi:hypothetical protein
VYELPLLVVLRNGSHLAGSDPQSCAQSAREVYISRRTVPVFSCPQAEMAEAPINTSVIDDEDRLCVMYQIP